jgi:hypothetical protein
VVALGIVPHARPAARHRVRFVMTPDEQTAGQYASLSGRIIRSRLAEAHVEIMPETSAPGDAADAPSGATSEATVRVTYSEKESGRFEVSNRYGRSRVPGIHMTVRLVVETVDGKPALDLSFTGKPPSSYSGSSFSTPDGLAFESLRAQLDDTGRAVAAVLGDADAIDALVHDTSKEAKRAVKALGLRADPARARARERLIARDLDGCQALGAPCLDTIRAFLHVHAKTWSVQGARYADAATLLGRMGDRDDVATLAAILTRTDDEKSKAAARDALWQAVVPALAQLGSPEALLWLAVYAATITDGERAPALVKARDEVLSRLLARGASPGRVVVDTRVASERDQATNLQAALDNAVGRAGVQPASEDGTGADGYLVAVHQGGRDQESDVVHVIAVDARSRELFGPFQLHVATERVRDTQSYALTTRYFEQYQPRLDALADCAFARCLRSRGLEGLGSPRSLEGLARRGQTRKPAR